MNHTVARPEHGIAAEWPAFLFEQIKLLQRQIQDMNEYIDSLERQCLALGDLLGKAKP